MALNTWVQMNLWLLHPHGRVGRAIKCLHQCWEYLRYAKAYVCELYFCATLGNLDQHLILFAAWRHRPNSELAYNPEIFQPPSDKFIKTLPAFSRPSIQFTFFRCRRQNRCNRELALGADVQWRIPGPGIDTFGRIPKRSQVIEILDQTFGFKSKIVERLGVLVTRQSTLRK